MEGLTCLVVLSVLVGTTFATDPLCQGVPPNEVVLFPYPNDCTKYYQCDNGIKTEKDCPSGFWFNVALQSCDHPDHSGCIQPSSSTRYPTSTVHPWCANTTIDFYPYTADCTMYYECYYGTLEEHSCPNGLWFNAREKRCVYPEQSGCGNYSTTTTEAPTSPSSTHRPTTGSTRTTTIKPTTSSVNPTTDSSSHYTIDPDCMGGKDDQYLFPYPGDCTKYLECAEGVKFVRDCPPNLWFNPTLLVCDEPKHSGCIPSYYD